MAVAVKEKQEGESGLRGEQIPIAGRLTPAPQKPNPRYRTPAQMRHRGDLAIGADDDSRRQRAEARKSVG